jgi:hypothetical protein
MLLTIYFAFQSGGDDLLNCRRKPNAAEKLLHVMLEPHLLGE